MFYKTLHDAITKEDVEDVILHLNHGADPNTRDSQGLTPLVQAIYVDNFEIFELLINAKADLYEQNSTYYDTASITVFYSAIVSRNSSIVKLALDVAASDGDRTANARIDSLTYALIGICNNGDVERAKILIDAGAQLTSDRYKDTGLHIAAEKKDLGILELLLSRKIDVDFKDMKYGRTALHCACFKNEGESHFEVIEKLLNGGADVNSQENRCLETALHYLMKKSSVKTVRLLLKFGADVDLTNRSGETPLVKAIEADKLELVKLLVEHGSNVHYVNTIDGTNLIHRVGRLTKGVSKIAKYLMKNGVNINATDFQGNTPLAIKLKNLIIGNSKVNNEALIVFMEYSDLNIDHLGDKNILTKLHTYGRAWKIILEHLAKLQALELPVHPNFLHTISNNPEFKYYFEKCTRELYIAKNSKPSNCWITYFNLLVDSKKMLKNYVGNQDLVDDVEKRDFYEKFRIYGECMKKNVSKGLKIRKLFDESIMVLHYSLPFFNPTHLIIRDVLDYLTRRDSSKLIEENKKKLIDQC